MITSHHIATDRLQMLVHTSGDSGTPVLFIHGNASSSLYWKGLMESLPAGFRGIAPDLRGYGDTDDLLIDGKLEASAIGWMTSKACLRPSALTAFT
jgi:pimeloyl-ACP methyl ester carboxylesterase